MSTFFSPRTESDFANEVLAAISPHFRVVGREVNGTHCSGRRIRIDAVIEPIDGSCWATPNAMFGVEFKVSRDPGNRGECTKLVHQAMCYAESKFDRLGFVHVLMCPESALQLPNDEPTLQGLLWRRGVAALEQDPFYGWCIRHSGRHRLWSELDGVHEAKRTRIVRKWGAS